MLFFQFAFDVPEDSSTFLFSLEQKDRLIGRHRTILPIGFVIMKIEVNRKYRCHLLQEKTYPSKYEVTRSVFARVILNAGNTS